MPKLRERNLTPLLQMLRNFLLGRKYNRERSNLRYQEDCSNRTQPPPILPEGPHCKLSNNYYYKRNPMIEVKPSNIIVETKVMNRGQPDEDRKCILIEEGNNQKSSQIKKMSKSYGNHSVIGQISEKNSPKETEFVDDNNLLMTPNIPINYFTQKETQLIPEEVVSKQPSIPAELDKNSIENIKLLDDSVVKARILHISGKDKERREVFTTSEIHYKQLPENQPLEKSMPGITSKEIELKQNSELGWRETSMQSSEKMKEIIRTENSMKLLSSRKKHITERLLKSTSIEGYFENPVKSVVKEGVVSSRHKPIKLNQPLPQIERKLLPPTDIDSSTDIQNNKKCVK